jgi:hypothetical protein
LLVAVLVAGCGGGGTTGGVESTKLSAQEILEESNLKMQEVTSLKANGFYKAAMGEAGSEAMDFDFEMEIDMTNAESPEVHMVMRGMGQDTEVYMSEGIAYASVPGQGWVKGPAGDTDSFKQATPAEIAKFAEDAEDLKILAEDGTHYELAFVISEQYLRNQMSSEFDMQDLGPEVEKMMNDMIKGMKMNAVFKIAKDTMFIEVAKIAMEIKDMPMLGSMTLDMELEFSDFNEPVAVALPAEAANAVESPDLSNTIPGFPGFGF